MYSCSWSLKKQKQNSSTINTFYSQNSKPGKHIRMLANVTSGNPYMYMKSGIRRENKSFIAFRYMRHFGDPRVGGSVENRVKVQLY